MQPRFNRCWIGFSELVDQADNFAADREDPVFAINEGDFEHGGIRLMTYWFDQNKMQSG